MIYVFQYSLHFGKIDIYKFFFFKKRNNNRVNLQMNIKYS